MPTKNQSLLSFAVARVAGLPIHLLDELAVENPDNWDKIIQNSENLAEEWARIYRKIQDFSQLEPLEKSLLFCSHDLLNQLPKMRDADPKFFLKKQRQTALGIYEYMARAATKTTPFAELGSVQLIDFEEVTNNLPDIDSFFSNSRWTAEPNFERTKLKLRHTVNVVFLERVFDLLLTDKKFAEQLDLRLNPGLFLDKNEEWIFPYFDGETEVFQKMKNNEILTQIHLFFSENEPAPRPHSAMFEWLISEQKIDETDAQLLLNQLVSVGFLEFLLPISGHEPDWQNRWLNKIAFLNYFEKQQDLATLQHWLNGTSKMIGWQQIDATQSAQIEATGRIMQFFDGQNTLKPTHIWYRDSLTEYEISITQTEMEQISAEIRAAIRATPDFKKNEFYQTVEIFCWNLSGKVANFSTDFVEFAQLYFQTEHPEINYWKRENHTFINSFTLEGQKIGVVFQPFRAENGEIGAVVNHIFAGGGRLFGRFLPFFSEKTADTLRDWNKSSANELTVAFYGQTFHNANLVGALADFELDFHGSRPRAAADKRIKLQDIGVKYDFDCCRFRTFYKKTDQWIRLLDLGLEAPDGRTPILQLFRALSQPPFQRVLETLKDRKNVIFQRAIHVHGHEYLPKYDFKNAFDSQWLRKMIQFQLDHELPRRCFCSIDGQTQYVDFQSVISMRHLFKSIKNAKNEHLIFTKMEPDPSQFLAEGRACEIVMEMVI